MLTVLSPAKKLSKECFVKTNNHNLPQFLDDSVGLVKELKKMTPPEFMSLMGISESLAELNWERMQEWNKTFTPDNSREAIFSFMGDTYSGLDAESLTNQDLEFAQNNVRILSGLYGLLRPLDLMKPYRLEMGTKFSNKRGKNLYDYWDDSLSNNINETMSFYKKINASAVFHNDHTAFRVDWMPFAGLKHSGHGVGGIKYTMHEMQIEKMMVLRN